MDFYRYVNRTPNTLTIGNITILPYGDYLSIGQPEPALERLDGVLVDKYFNGAGKQDPVEFNYYRPVVSHEKGDGLRLNAANPQFGWHDLLSPITIDTGAMSGKPTFTQFVGAIKKYQFKVGDESFHQYHILHDHAPNTDMFIHTHWAVKTTPTPGGSVTWQFEISYAKGYQQAEFNVPVTLTVNQTVNSTALVHHIAEVQFTSVGGVGGKIDSGLIETDGIILVRNSLLENTTGQDPFLLYCDIHYQSTGIPTKNKNYNFWQ